MWQLRALDPLGQCHLPILWGACEPVNDYTVLGPGTNYSLEVFFILLNILTISS
ncbi:MAG: hypothetical protein KAX31_03840 [Thermoplasmata archaeon]|nr:hypothetical protein [Thermoplasmata archaeon]